MTPQTTRTRFLLLVLDPDTSTANALAEQLQERQIDVVVTGDPADALLQAGALLPDAVLTATDVPPMRGSTIARALHTRACIPTLVGVGEHDGMEGSLALAAGATACVARPYRVTEILPMLRAISPDTAADFQVAVEVGTLRLDPARTRCGWPAGASNCRCGSSSCCTCSCCTPAGSSPDTRSTGCSGAAKGTRPTA
nr:hypothetical protein [Micromonospora acroterricola]